MPPKLNTNKPKVAAHNPDLTAVAARGDSTPWDLFYIAEKQLSKLGLKKLIELCQERAIAPGDTVESCVRLLLHWKAHQKKDVSTAKKSPSPTPDAPSPAAQQAPRVKSPSPAAQQAPRVKSPSPAAQQAPRVAGQKPHAADPPASSIFTAPPAASRTYAFAGMDLRFVSWNIKFLSRNNGVWDQRKINIMETLRSLNPDFIAVQELMSGDGAKTDGGKLAAEEIRSALGQHWCMKYCDTQEKSLGGKRNERILFMWSEEHAILRGRTPVLNTLAMNVVDSKRSAAVGDVPRSYAALSLTQFISAVTDGKVCRESDLEREKKRILDGLKTEIGYTAAANFNFSRNPALLTFPANDASGLPPLLVLSYHLDTDRSQNSAEIYVLQGLAALAWEQGVQLICMGDHNADEASNTNAWHDSPVAKAIETATKVGVVARFERLSQRVFSLDLFTNRFPFALKPAHNDDIFAPRHWALTSHDIGLIPPAIHAEGERLAVQSGDIKTKFTFLDQVWSDHRPLAASFHFEMNPAVSSKAAVAVGAKGTPAGSRDALSQAPTPVKTKLAAAGGGPPLR